MGMHRQIIIGLLLLLPFATNLKAQEYDTTTTTVTTVETIVADEEAMDDEDDDEDVEASWDTIINIHPIDIPADSIAAWKRKKELAYLQKLDSLLKAEQDKQLTQPVIKGERKTPSLLQRILDGGFLKMLAWIIALFFVGMIFFQFMKSKGFFRKDIYANVGAEDEGEEVQELPQDLDALLHQAHKLGDYRMATRYQFLRTLKLLQQKELVTYAADKTNSRYVNEIPVQWRKEFSMLIRNYEYTWYGHFEIGKEQYQQLSALYTSFNNKI